MNPLLEWPKLRMAYGLKEYEFKTKITTSRGSMERKVSWFVLLYDELEPALGGLGEVSPLPGLSIETNDEVAHQLNMVAKELQAGMAPDWSSLSSSVKFGIECALADWRNGGKGLLFKSPFTEAKSTLSINGLVWMNDYDSMLQEALSKVKQGFRCIKFKIGHLEWEKEKHLIAALRNRFSPLQLEIRVDANGAYTFKSALPVLMELARLGVHSIEQPLMATDREDMKKLIKLTPVPIALDEQLIAEQNGTDELAFLKDLNPQYIVLKPTLIGGLDKTRRWIEAARKMNIGWWITSSLETPIALNALAQFTAAFEPSLPQGLSTGKIFREDFTVPVQTEGQTLTFNPNADFPSAQLFRTLIDQ